MIVVSHPGAFLDMVGHQFGPSEWLAVTQDMIDGFAAVTGDHQWIHCDPERAAREFPGGRTIAHGYLTLSLLPRLQDTLYRVDNVRNALNYGANKLRFISPVPSGDRVRLVQTLKAAEAVDPAGVRITVESVFELDGSDRPALAIETIGLLFQ